MAPRKRRTKKSSKPEMASPCKELLEDLKLRIEDKLRQMAEKEQKAIASIESIFHSAEMNLPKNLREMTIGEYKKRGQGDLSKLVPRLAKQDSAQTSSVGRTYRSIGNLTQKLSSAKKATLSASTAKRAGAKRAAVIVSPKNTMLRPRTRKVATSNSSVPAGVKRSRESSNITDVFASPPRRRKTASQTNQNSKQIITPKFDLRKPVAASKCRAPRPGEVLVSVSGSPLQNPPASQECLVSLRGQVLDLEELMPAAELDEKIKLQLQVIQQKISRIQF